MLTIYNTLTRQKEPFKPLQAGKVGMYVCGMTVYDYCHIGHARVMVVFDVVSRYLRSKGYDLTYVRNITDIDDKIIKRADETGESIERLTARYIDAMHEDEAVLNVLRPDIEPRATQSMSDIIHMIQALLDNGYAYVGRNGDVFFAVNRFQDYGCLSGKNPDELKAGQRVDVNEAKNNPLDFVLWKMAKSGEPSWESPWGLGRPGWHIECSAMSTHCLGDRFDIHGGGMDLQFPHHENEIAQSQGATGKKFVNYWMHNGFVRVDEEKMSKSLGNFFTVNEVLKVYPRPDVVRFFILNSHYRSPLNYATEQLDESNAALTRLYTALNGLSLLDSGRAEGQPYLDRFNAAMDDDFNTPVALSVLFDLAREINRQKSDHREIALKLGGLLTELGNVLGILQSDPDQWLKQGQSNVTLLPTGGIEIPACAPQAFTLLSDASIEQFIAERRAARENMDWAEADRIRDELKTAGVILEDSDGETTWRRE